MKTPRILILSADTGKTSGSVAETLAGQLKKMNLPADVLDALIMVPENSDLLAHWGKSRFYHSVSRLLGRSYSREERHAAQVLYRRCALGAEALHAVLEKERYDAVICVHVFSCMMMTEIRRVYGNTPPFWFVATDYSCAVGIDLLEADGYFVPHRMLFGDFIRCGISADRLFATGIPLPERFRSPDDMEKGERKRALGLDPDSTLLVLRGGNMENSATGKRIGDLFASLPANAALAVLCGKNEKLRRQLMSLQSERLLLPGFEEDAARFLSVADLCIGRPRGLPCAEALACSLPLILYRELPGTEARNYDFLIRMGVATGSGSWREVTRLVGELLSNRSEKERLQSARERFLPAEPAEQICRAVCRGVS